MDLALVFWLQRQAELLVIEEQLRRVALRKVQDMVAKLQPPSTRPARSFGYAVGLYARASAESACATSAAGAASGSTPRTLHSK